MPVRAGLGGRKNDGGSWFGVAHNTASGVGANPVKAVDGVKVEGQNWSRFRKTGEVTPHWRMEGLKVGDQNSPRAGEGPSPHFTNPEEGRKHRGSGAVWFDTGPASFGSKSSARKAASARIAKIPLALSRHIAAAWKP